MYIPFEQRRYSTTYSSTCGSFLSVYSRQYNITQYLTIRFAFTYLLLLLSLYLFCPSISPLSLCLSFSLPLLLFSVSLALYFSIVYRHTHQNSRSFSSVKSVTMIATIHFQWRVALYQNIIHTFAQEWHGAEHREKERENKKRKQCNHKHNGEKQKNPTAEQGVICNGSEMNVVRTIRTMEILPLAARNVSAFSVRKLIRGGSCVCV